MSFIQNFIAQHGLLFYGVIAIAVCLIVFFLFYFIFRPLLRVYLDKGQGWYLIGFVIPIVIGFFTGRMFSLFFCTDFLPFLCTGATYIFSVVGMCIIFWRVTRFKEKEL